MRPVDEGFMGGGSTVEHFPAMGEDDEHGEGEAHGVEVVGAEAGGEFHILGPG